MSTLDGRGKGHIERSLPLSASTDPPRFGDVVACMKEGMEGQIGVIVGIEGDTVECHLGNGMRIEATWVFFAGINLPGSDAIANIHEVVKLDAAYRKGTI